MDKDRQRILKELIPAEYKLNLSDFALFLSVMKSLTWRCRMIAEEMTLQNGQGSTRRFWTFLS